MTTQTVDPYARLIELFDLDETAARFVADDGDGGFVGAVYRMARHIDRLEADATADEPGADTEA